LAQPRRQALVGQCATRPGQRGGSAVRVHASELGEHAAQAVQRRRALFLQPLAHAMQRQARLLLDRLDRHKAHLRLAHRRADRGGVVGVVLAR
jgi:hypothetical protein